MSRPTLSALDSSLYPIIWEQQTFTDAHSLLMALITDSITLEAKDFANWLLANDIYQEWINATVFGRYIQRQFAAFYHQSEDSFNIDIPTLFRNELYRYGQYLPLEQMLFVAGNLPKETRQEKIFTTTLNPVTVWIDAQKLTQGEDKLALIDNQQSITNQAIVNQPIINQIQVTGNQVLSFPIRHNKRTSDCLRNEVLILDFHDLRLVNEIKITAKKRSNIDCTILLRTYELR